MLVNHSLYSLAIHVKEVSNHPNLQQRVKADFSTRMTSVLFIKDRKEQPLNHGLLIPFILALCACYE